VPLEWSGGHLRRSQCLRACIGHPHAQSHRLVQLGGPQDSANPSFVLESAPAGIQRFWQFWGGEKQQTVKIQLSLGTGQTVIDAAAVLQTLAPKCPRAHVEMRADVRGDDGAPRVLSLAWPGLVARMSASLSFHKNVSFSQKSLFWR